MKDKPPQLISRRALLRGAGAAAAARAVGMSATTEAATAPPVATASDGIQTAVTVPARTVYEQLTADEAELLQAIAGQLIPADEHGPGAVEAGAVSYIDRALGGALSSFRSTYRSGLAAFDRYCRSSFGASFTELSNVDQISALIDLESGIDTSNSADFFDMVRSHVLQGTFGDPYYGGNQNFVGWDLIGYPGVRTSVSPGLQTRLEAGELKPNHRSAYDSGNFEKAVVSAATKEGWHGD